MGAGGLKIVHLVVGISVFFLLTTHSAYLCVLNTTIEIRVYFGGIFLGMLALLGPKTGQNQFWAKQKTPRENHKLSLLK